MNEASAEALKVIEYSPVEKAEKPHNICVPFPHMKDSFWVAVAYGITKQSKALGVSMNLYEAGGYDNLPKQLSQFDDCIASGADAIVIGAISTVGVAKQVAAAKAKGIPEPRPDQRLAADDRAQCHRGCRRTLRSPSNTTT